jgi:hypothetical protein
MNTNTGFASSISVYMLNASRTSSSAVPHGLVAGRVVSIVTKLQDVQSKIQILAGLRDFFSSRCPDCLCGLQSPIQRVWGSAFPGRKLAGVSGLPLSSI